MMDAEVIVLCPRIPPGVYRIAKVPARNCPGKSSTRVYPSNGRETYMGVTERVTARSNGPEMFVPEMVMTG